jgi:hypothetical protein
VDQLPDDGAARALAEEECSARYQVRGLAGLEGMLASKGRPACPAPPRCSRLATLTACTPCPPQPSLPQLWLSLRDFLAASSSWTEDAVLDDDGQLLLDIEAIRWGGTLGRGCVS